MKRTEILKQMANEKQEPKVNKTDSSYNVYEWLADPYEQFLNQAKEKRSRDKEIKREMQNKG